MSEPFPLPPEVAPQRHIPPCEFCVICQARGTMDESSLCLKCREEVDKAKQAVNDRWLEDGE